MSGAAFHISFPGELELEREIGALASRVGDLSPLMDIFGVVLETGANDNFEGEHAPDGVPWAMTRRKREHGGMILQGTPPRLRPSISYRFGATWVEVGTNVVYARRHQEGFDGIEQVASHKRVLRQVFGVQLAEPIEVTVAAFSRHGNTPKREFLGLSAGGRAELYDQAAAYVGAQP